MPNYFLVAVSNRRNLDLCLKHALAGFTDSINGLWAYSDIQEGDYISFLYGAKVYNLYHVLKKYALEGANELGPWPPVTFKRSGKTYYFPFRLQLRPIREFQESLVRWEFVYVAENLLLRGGYGKTQFQADQTTLHQVSQMGSPYTRALEPLDIQQLIFAPRFAFSRQPIAPPQVYLFREVILQALIKRHLAEPSRMRGFFSALGLTSLDAKSFEVLGERALPEGHIDIFIKESAPVGVSSNLVLEVKVGQGVFNDVEQLRKYISEIGQECQGGILVARQFANNAKVAAQQARLKLVTYSFTGLASSDTHTFDEMQAAMRLTPVQ